MISCRIWRRAASLFTALLLVTGSLLTAAAADTSQSYLFQLTVNGEEQISAVPGENVEVTLKLFCTDVEENITMYAMSSIVRFNSSMFELEELTGKSGISAVVTERRGNLEGWTDITLNYLAPGMSGVEWENGTVLLTLTLKAVNYGSSLIQLVRGAVSTYSGMESFSVSVSNAVVSVPNDTTNPDDTTDPDDAADPDDKTDPDDTADPDDKTDPDGTADPDDTDPAGSLTPEEPEINPSVFSDVEEDAWYAEAVQYVVSRNYFNGIGEGKFGPDLTMTRAMFVTVLGRIAGADVSQYTESMFADVPEGQWYTSYVEWASENGIIKGYDSSSFGPDDSVTREQMAAILYRYAAYTGADLSVSSAERFCTFDDADSVSGYARDAMIWAVEKKLINGMGDGRLAPGETAVRAQVAQIIMNFDQNI